MRFSRWIIVEKMEERRSIGRNLWIRRRFLKRLHSSPRMKGRSLSNGWYIKTAKMIVREKKKEKCWGSKGSVVVTRSTEWYRCSSRLIFLDWIFLTIRIIVVSFCKIRRKTMCRCWIGDRSVLWKQHGMEATRRY